ncbi:MAG: PucR family transcriptional regulator [Solirubrobacteraceae bacterium]
MSGPATVRGAAGPALDPGIAGRLRRRLPAVAEQTVLAVIAEVPGYAGALSGDMRANIERAVQMALGGFVRLAENARDADPRTPLEPARAAAYQLGRGEARDGRTMDALLAAYRVGARVAWRELSSVMVEEALPAAAVAEFAELVFAYIDELSAASVAGHEDERATTGRVRELYLERLGQRLIEGAPGDVLAAAAERAGWDPPQLLTAVLVPDAQVRPALATLDRRTLRLPGDVAGADDAAVLLVPDAAGPRRARLLRALEGRDAIVGPARPWTAVAASVHRARRVRDLITPRGREAVDTEVHLATLLIQSDFEALADLRRQVLEPLSVLRPSGAERLEQTLRSWLLHQGRRDDVAAELMVHPQTVRYRMTQLRELYGDRLRDPRAVLELVIALGVPPAAG